MITTRVLNVQKLRNCLLEDTKQSEDVTERKDSLPGHGIIDTILENISMKQQLQKIAHNDVLIGMKGAGNVHALFLPSHAVLLELFVRVISLLILRRLNSSTVFLNPYAIGGN
ncbi:hypothetical protein ACJMK2_042095 [Sinanodonta woodiana]|uniref:Uncharacterized protein n=1 Tax=Sinanodonta woodiana TaxID=1069815 RepID=A0ABD3WA14_SINWO